jgi:hypothetical protein
MFSFLSLGFSSTFKMICYQIDNNYSKIQHNCGSRISSQKIFVWKQSSPDILDVPTFDKLVFKHYPKTSPDNCLRDQRAFPTILQQRQMNAERNITKFYYSCPHASQFVPTSWLCKQWMMPVTALDYTSILITHRRKIDISRNTLAEIAKVILNLKPLMTHWKERNEVTITTWYKRVRKGLTYTHLTTPDANDSLKTLWSTNIPSKIIIQFGWIRKSRKWVIVINLQNKE